MKKIIKIKQEIIEIDPGIYDVDIKVDEGDIQVFEYNDTNAIYPLYNSLIQVIKEMEDVHIELETSDKRFAIEISGNPNRNSRMLEILIEIKERRNITINAY